MSKNILVFTQITKEEIELNNTLFNYFKAQKRKMYLVLFEHFEGNINNFKADYICLNSMILLNVLVDSKSIKKYLEDSYIEKLITIEKNFYNLKEIPINYFTNQANSFYFLINKLFKTLKPELTIIDPNCYTAMDIVRKCLLEAGLPYVKKDRWVFRKSFQISEYEIFKPEWKLNPNNIDVTEIEKKRITHLFTNPTSKYFNNIHKKVSSIEKYVLFLGTRGSMLPWCKGAEAYFEIGFGWGSDLECAIKIEHIIDEIDPSYSLFVRQHPYEKPRISINKFKKNTTQLVNDYELFDLIKNAALVICMTTTTVYHALMLNKKVCVLGNYEFNGEEELPCLKNQDELKEWVSKSLKDNNSNLITRHDKILNFVTMYYKNHVIEIENGNVKNDIVIQKYLDNDNDNHHHNNTNVCYWYKLKFKLFLKKLYYGLHNLLKFKSNKLNLNTNVGVL